ncbi:MAG: hypothetical protein AAFX99_28275, partial [Myxococcota bacterium]
RRFEAALEEVLGFFQADPARAQLLLRELLDRPKAFEARLKRHLGHWIALVIGYIRRGQDEGLIHPEVDPYAYVLHVVAMMVTATAASPVTSSLLQPHTDEHDTTGRDTLDRSIQELVRMARYGLFIHPER